MASGRVWRLWRTAAIACLLSASLCAVAADNAAVFAWAKRHTHKDKSDLGSSEPLPLGSIVRLRVRLEPFMTPNWLGRYDFERGTAEIHLGSFLFHVAVHESCVDAGEFQGDGGTGPRLKLRTRVCERLLLWPQNRPPGEPRSIAMGPAQYQEFKTQLSHAELEVELAASSEGKVVDYLEGVRSATMSFPVEVRGRTWSMYGTVRRIDFLLPGGVNATVVP